MKIDVRFRGIGPSELLRAHVIRRIHIQLRRFAAAIRSVVVTIADVNGPRGGVDKRCQVDLRGPALGQRTIEQLDGDAYAAVDLAVSRAAFVAGRRLARARAGRRQHGALGGAW